jgi:DNA-binding transcriptional ArsR family regulator
MSKDTCQVNVIDRDKIELAQKGMPETTTLSETADVFSLLGDLSRIRILQALSTTELCVCDLAAILETTSSAVSHQLRLLRAKGIVRFRREGKIAYYSLADEHVRQLLKQMIKHIEEC